MLRWLPPEKMPGGSFSSHYRPSRKGSGVFFATRGSKASLGLRQFLCLLEDVLTEPAFGPCLTYNLHNGFA